MERRSPDGFLGLSLNDRTILFLVFLVDKRVETVGQSLCIRTFAVLLLHHRNKSYISSKICSLDAWVWPHSKWQWCRHGERQRFFLLANMAVQGPLISTLDSPFGTETESQRQSSRKDFLARARSSFSADQIYGSEIFLPIRKKANWAQNWVKIAWSHL